MSIPEVEFSTAAQLLDRPTGRPYEVRVRGSFVGTGIDPHEVVPIQQWICRALIDALGTYQGSLADLPALSSSWGAAVGAQLAGVFQQHFEARGHIRIDAVEVSAVVDPLHRLSQPAINVVPAPVLPAPLPAPPPKDVLSDPAILRKAAQQLVAQLALPPALAMQAAQVVFQVLRDEQNTGPTEDEDELGRTVPLKPMR